MNNFAELLTPSEYLKRYPVMEKQHTLKQLEAMAKSKGLCDVCGQENIWKLGACGMCFTCTTGESDASDDLELVEG